MVGIWQERWYILSSQSVYSFEQKDEARKEVKLEQVNSTKRYGHSYMLINENHTIVLCK